MKKRGERRPGWLRAMRAQRGVTTLEYAIMLVLVSVAVSTFGLGLGGSVTSVFSRMVLSLADDVDGNDPERQPTPSHQEVP